MTDAINEAIETVQDMLDVMEASGSCYAYMHNGGDARLQNVLDCLRAQREQCGLTNEQLGRLVKNSYIEGYEDCKAGKPPLEKRSNEPLATKKNICGCTNLECSFCTLGPCDHRKEPERNEPLTLAELREMSGEPVWWWNTSAKPVCTICVFDRFMSEPMFANYDWQSEDAVKLTKYKWLKKCGYKPYRHKPKEDAHE